MLSKKYVIVFLVLFLSLVSLVFAQIPISYKDDTRGPLFSFGSIQSVKSKVASPGDNVTFTMYFFSDLEYANRVSHIYAKIEESPLDWYIEFNPPALQKNYNISGIIKSISDNIYVEPRPLLPAPPAKSEKDYVYIQSPSGKGYLQTRPINVTVYVPNNAKIGESYHVKVVAQASWYETTGTAALNQERVFRYDIFLASKTYTEEEILPKPPPGIANVTPILQPSDETEKKSEADNTTIILIALIVIVIALLGYILLKRKPKYEEVKSTQERNTMKFETQKPVLPTKKTRKK